MENLQYKDFQIKEFKAEDDGRMTITAYAAVFGNRDTYNDIINKGAFAETLADEENEIAFCYQHDIHNPIGKIEEIKEDDTGLYVKVKLSAAEDKIQTKVREGILSKLSIGFVTIDCKYDVIDSKNVRTLLKIKLYEVSLVTRAANVQAKVLSMKSEEYKTTIEQKFDELINGVRNDEIKSKILSLKADILSINVETHKEEAHEEPTMTKNEILKILQ